MDYVNSYCKYGKVNNKTITMLTEIRILRQKPYKTQNPKKNL